MNLAEVPLLRCQRSLALGAVDVVRATVPGIEQLFGGDVGVVTQVAVADVLTRSPRLSPGYPMVAVPLANRNCRPLRPWRLSNGSLMSCGTRRSWST